MGTQYDGLQDGHELDEAIYLASGYTICANCGGQFYAYYSGEECHPYNWRAEASQDRYYFTALTFAEQNERYTAIRDRVEKDKTNGLMPVRPL
jgi:hypothetical protein